MPEELGDNSIPDGSGVSDERWKDAQRWEKSYWDKYVTRKWSLRRLYLIRNSLKALFGGDVGDDSNVWWASQFDDYRFVPRRLENVVEFGCGPFTNLRLILEKRETRFVFASDPLARHYVGYRGFQLARKWKSREYLIDDHPMEDAPFASDYFDLVACINVLDHVRDPQACMRQMTRVLAPRGIVIFGQDLTSEDDLEATEAERTAAKDVGHPHRFEEPEELLRHFEGFDPLISKVLSRDEGRSPRYHFGTLIYAGRRR